jgi:hypothetical protein
LLDGEEFTTESKYRMLGLLYEIMIKALNCLDPSLSRLWKKATLITGTDSLLGQAKVKDMVLNGYYSTESELLNVVNSSSSGVDFIKNWKEVDYGATVSSTQT